MIDLFNNMSLLHINFSLPVALIKAIFRFPKDEARRRQWMIAVRRENWVPSDNSRICSIHFETNYFLPDGDRLALKPEAVPSIFPELCTSMQKVCTLASLKFNLFSEYAMLVLYF